MKHEIDVRILKLSNGKNGIKVVTGKRLLVHNLLVNEMRSK